jgi:small conductance mechanosensitive channel
MNYFSYNLPQWRKIIIFCFVSIITIILTLSWTEISKAQLPLPNSVETSSKLPEGVTRYGYIEVAPVKSPIDGKILFQVASPTIFDRNNLTEDQLPAEIRAEEVTANLRRALFGRFQDTETLRVSVTTLNNLLIIQVTDDKSTRPLRLITVTELDADFEGKIPEELAQEWQKILEAELTRGIKLFSSTEILSRLKQVVQIFLGVLVISAFIWLCQRGLDNQLQKLKAKQAEKEQKTPEQNSSAPSSPGEAIALMRSRFLSQIKNQFSLQKQLDFYSFWQWLLFWLQVVIIYGGIVWIVCILPGLMQYRDWFLSFPIKLLSICFFTSLWIKLSNWIIDRIFNAWRKNQFLSLGESQRKELRTSTISQAVQGLVTFLLLFAAVVGILNIFGVSSSSVIAGGAIIGFAVTLGSQNLVKDLVNGFLILGEDQYAVGDIIDLGHGSGLVENLNLRVTQIRDAEGSLITIPNSSIVEVKNLTRNWSRVNFTIEVAYDADIDLALNLLKQVGQEMFEAREWKESILEQPQVLGVDNVSHTGLLIRVWIKTVPLQQWSVGREFRYRVRLAFEKNGIDIGKPQYIAYNTSLES